MVSLDADMINTGFEYLTKGILTVFGTLITLTAIESACLIFKKSPNLENGSFTNLEDMNRYQAKSLEDQMKENYR